MVKNAVGMIETLGLAAAVEAADAAVKAADVRLVGYELTRGMGWVLVKVVGDVGAVKAAVEAGKTAAGKVNKVIATHVIQRPYKDLSSMLLTRETVGLALTPKAPSSGEQQEGCDDYTEHVAPDQNPDIEVPLVTEQAEDISREPEEREQPQDDPAVRGNQEEPLSEDRQNSLQEATCNLCFDPACPRKKGDPRVNCIHYNTNTFKKESD